MLLDGNPLERIAPQDILAWPLRFSVYHWGAAPSAITPRKEQHTRYDTHSRR